MRKFILLFVALAHILAASAVLADPIPLNTDVAVTLTATPISNLAPGNSIVFTMTVTNNGPSSLGYVAIVGPQISNQFNLPSGSWNDCNMVTVTGDSTNGPFWIPEWFPSGYVGENPMAVGETRTCHFTLTITSAAPPAYAFTMALPNYWSDINPNNDAGTVVLQRAIEPIPALSPALLLLMAGLLAVSAGVALGRRQMSS